MKSKVHAHIGLPRAVTALVCCALLACTTGALAAQEARPEHLPRVLVRDIPLIDRVLQLDANQRAIVDLLVEDIEAAGGSRESVARFRADLEAVLTDAQRARMPEVWAMVYRERMESAGAIGGEAVDVGALARAAMRGEAVDALERAITAYRAELDPLLDLRAATSEPAALIRVRLDVRAVNDRAIDALAGAMPEPLVGRFRRDARAKGFPSACAASNAISSLDLLLRERATEPLQRLRTDAETRFEAIVAKGVAAVRERDTALASSPEAQAVAARAVEAAEKDYDAFEPWLIKEIVRIATEESLQQSAIGRMILERAKANAGGADHPWHDTKETLKRFDANGNGEIDGEESSAVLDAFSRSVGKQQRRRL